MNLCALEAFAASIISSIVASGFPYAILSAIVPANKTGSWPTNPIYSSVHENCILRLTVFLSSLTEISFISSPSISILPEVGV